MPEQGCRLRHGGAHVFGTDGYCLCESITPDSEQVARNAVREQVARMPDSELKRGFQKIIENWEE